MLLPQSQAASVCGYAVSFCSIYNAKKADGSMSYMYKYLEIFVVEQAGYVLPLFFSVLTEDKSPRRK